MWRLLRLVGLGACFAFAVAFLPSAAWADSTEPPEPSPSTSTGTPAPEPSSASVSSSPEPEPTTSEPSATSSETSPSSPEPSASVCGLDPSEPCYVALDPDLSAALLLTAGVLTLSGAAALVSQWGR